VTHQSSTELASLEQAATTLNDSNAVSRTIHVFDGKEAVPFPGIQELKMTGIPGRPGNGNPGMQTLTHTDTNLFYNLSHAICYSYVTDNNQLINMLLYQINHYYYYYYYY